MASLSKVWEYLFKDFEYVRQFDHKLDYEAYWRARLQWGTPKAELRIVESKRQLIARLIDRGSTVLDVGCGDGSLLAYLREAKSIVPTGIDVSTVSCELARRKGIEVIDADISRDDVLIPRADYIVLSEVLEHLPNPEALLARLRDKFTRRLLIDIPNSGAMNDRLRLLFGRFPKQWVFHPAEHLRFWTVRDFMFLCQQLGYQVDRYYGIYDPEYQFGLAWWRLYPRLFSRYVLYVLH